MLAHSKRAYAVKSKVSDDSKSNSSFQVQTLRTEGHQARLTLHTINPLIRTAEYAVRGAIPMRAEALSEANGALVIYSI